MAGDCTFPPSRRLKTPAEFKHVWTAGRRLSGDSLTIANCRNNLDHPRLGISLSKKRIRNAVDRNRLKRLARETFRHIQHQLGGQDCILTAYPGIDALPHSEQHQHFEALWKRLADISKKRS